MLTQNYVTDPGNEMTTTTNAPVDEWVPQTESFRSRLKKLYITVLFALLRRVGFEPVVKGRLAAVTTTCVELIEYIARSGAMHELWDRNPRAFKRITRYTEHLARLVVSGIPTQSDQDELFTSVMIAGRLSGALMEVQHLQNRVVALEKQLADVQGNERANIRVVA